MNFNLKGLQMFKIQFVDGQSAYWKIIDSKNVAFLKDGEILKFQIWSQALAYCDQLNQDLKDKNMVPCPACDSKNDQPHTCECLFCQGLGQVFNYRKTLYNQVNQMNFFKFGILFLAFLLSTGEANAQRGSRSSGGSSSFGRSYSTGRSSSAPSFSRTPTSALKVTPNVPSASKFTPSASVSGSGKSYSTGGSSVITNSSKPNSTTFNNNLSNSVKHIESQKKYEASNSTKPTFISKGSDGKIKEHIVNSNSAQVKTVRNYVTHERYVTYDNRSSIFYGHYYTTPYYYHDSFSPFLMGWILSDALNSHDRALWMYHHSLEMDQARYNELLRRDARLQAEIDQLKSQNVVRDPGYVPVQMKDNPDIMYNKDFVDAAYNPVEVSSGGFWYFVYFLLMILFVLSLAVFVYLFFFKEF